MAGMRRLRGVSTEFKSRVRQLHGGSGSLALVPLWRFCSWGRLLRKMG